MSKSTHTIEKQIHNGIVNDCIRANVTDPKQIKRIATAAVRRISKMTVAGIKAAKSKGQQINFTWQ